MNVFMVLLMMMSMTGAAPARTPVLVWSDEFNAAYGVAPGPDWAVERVDCCGDEIQSYVDGRMTSQHDGLGRMVLTARKQVSPTGRQYVSARLSNGFSNRPHWTTYGRLEARMWLPTGAGLNPAFWTLGDWNRVQHWPRTGEIDIMESPHRGNRTHGGIHTTRVSDDSTHWNTGGSRAGSYAGAWHVWRIDWRPGVIAWAVDGIVWQTITRAQVEAAGARWKFDGEQPQAIIINLAVGGSWSGAPTGWTSQSMYVDWVRVWA